MPLCFASVVVSLHNYLWSNECQREYTLHYTIFQLAEEGGGSLPNTAVRYLSQPKETQYIRMHSGDVVEEEAIAKHRSILLECGCVGATLRAGRFVRICPNRVEKERRAIRINRAAIKETRKGDKQGKKKKLETHRHTHTHSLLEDCT